jgi:hypothetical protein
LAFSFTVELLNSRMQKKMAQAKKDQQHWSNTDFSDFSLLSFPFFLGSW